MTATLILWSYGATALLFAALALWALRRHARAVPQAPLAVALGATALWALATAGIGPREMMTLITEGLRNLAWLGFMIMLHRRDGNDRPPLALNTVYGVVALVSLTALGLELAGHGAPEELAERIQNASLLFRMLVAVAALVLVQALFNALGTRGRGLRWVAGGIAVLWLIDLNVFAAAYLGEQWPVGLIAARGIAMMGVATLIAVGLQQRGNWNVQVSRTVAYQSLSLVAIGLYFVLLALATSALATIGGTQARVLQTAFVFGSTAAILTLASSPWLRAWAKVKMAKHFFRHRYDYRAEWMQFTETLGAREGAAPLDERIVKAIADLTDSPAGLLLVPEGAGLGPGAAWNWEETNLVPASDAALPRHLAASGRILDLDSLRDGADDTADLDAVPAWMLELRDAWVLVPLPHQGQLAGAILLARPPVKRPLDWEDFDLLKVAGRQVASYLAEARAQEALADAQRFDEFNRRFAFIVHDIKNLVSQLTLTARNAERHADNPEFRADMIATLRDSSERMNALLARLSQHHRARADAPRAIELAPLAERVASAYAGRNPVTVHGNPDTIAQGDPARLEQLLGHLVQNAIDASPMHEPVTITLGGDGPEVTIDVTDRGCGMSPAFIRDKLFKPFVSSKDGGFGIGAYEARELATGMGGRIDVISREGRGSRFRVTLKAALRTDLAVEKAA